MGKWKEGSGREGREKKATGPMPLACTEPLVVLIKHRGSTGGPDGMALWARCSPQALCLTLLARPL